MSGRGRGRGRGRSAPTGARLLLQRSAQEAGLDAGNLRNLQDITRPKLFPDYEWHSNGSIGHDNNNSNTATSTNPASSAASTTSSAAAAASSAAAKRSASNVYLINKSREIHHRFQNSPYFVRPMQEVDVVRYGKRPRPMEPDVAVLEYIGKAADDRYLPEELKKRVSTTLKEVTAGEENIPQRPLTLEELAVEELEQKRQGKVDTEEAGDGEGELSDTLEVEEEDEEEVADYTTNYYQSDDDEGSDGGGGEDGAFFE